MSIITSLLKSGCLLIAVLWLSGCGDNQPESQWYKGNTHTHTLLSGHGDSTPQEVYDWYDRQGYDFLALSEHDRLIDVSSISTNHAILLPSVEVSMPSGIHVTALNTKGHSRAAYPTGVQSQAEYLQDAIAVSSGYGATTILNHPNWWGSVFSEDAISRVPALEFMEIYNPVTGKTAQNERLWDVALSSGVRVYGVAADDAHILKTWGGTNSNPSKGWIMVRSESLTPDAIVSAMRKGDFYASTGPEVLQCARVGGEYTVSLSEESKIEFIGTGGFLLSESYGRSASQSLQGQVYVRAKITNSDGTAWCQPALMNRGLYE